MNMSNNGLPIHGWQKISSKCYNIFEQALPCHYVQNDQWTHGKRSFYLCEWMHKSNYYQLYEKFVSLNCKTNFI
jgi:hypothetical protein